MNEAMRVLEDQFQVAIQEFTVAAVRREEDQEYIHHWYLGSDDPMDAHKVALALDEHLKEANKNYRVARGKALKDVRVEVVPADVFYQWSEASKKKGGQVKTPRVMVEEKFREWEAFAKQARAGS
jgi:hypothetical protein